MKNDSSPGIDDIDVKVVKHVISVISNPLASIFNDCLFNGTFPTKMKIARVTPIHKKGKQNDVNNYRPISVFANIFQNIRKVYLQENNRFLRQTQYSYETSIWI